jgi:hypothetical protein
MQMKFAFQNASKSDECLILISKEQKEILCFFLNLLVGAFFLFRKLHILQKGF